MKLRDMGLFDRMSRAASANFNALVAKLEDPRKEIELTIREMEDLVRSARQEIVRTIASEKQARKRIDDLAPEIARWERRAELAVEHGDDDLAREALRQKRRLVAEGERAEALRKEHLAIALDQRAELERMERTVVDVKGKKGLLAAKVGQARSVGGPEGLGARPGADAFGEFRRMEDQIEGVEAAIAADREVRDLLGAKSSPAGLTGDEVEAKFRELERGAPDVKPKPDDVDDELTALKTRIRVGPG